MEHLAFLSTVIGVCFVLLFIGSCYYSFLGSICWMLTVVRSSTEIVCSPSFLMYSGKCAAIPLLVLGLIWVVFGSGWLLVWIPILFRYFNGSVILVMFNILWYMYLCSNCECWVSWCHTYVWGSVKKSFYGILTCTQLPVVRSVYWHWSVDCYFMVTSKFCQLGHSVFSFCFLWSYLLNFSGNIFFSVHWMICHVVRANIILG